ncbi:MAG: VTT domain-containing protein [Chloroflexota bacterium]
MGEVGKAVPVAWWRRKESIISLIAIVAVVAGCALVIGYWDRIRYLGGYGYPGVFVVSFVAGGSVPVPLPYIVVVFTLGAVLKPALVGAVSGLGCAVGHLVVYLTGFAGRSLMFSLPDESRLRRIYDRMLSGADKRGSLFVFAMTAILNPFVLPMTIALSSLRFPTWKFFLMSWLGNTVKSMMIAYAGYYGLGHLLSALGLVI